MEVVRVFTHHAYPHEASEAFLRDNVVAVGFVYDRQIALHASKEAIIKDWFARHPSESDAQAIRAASDFCRFRDEINHRYLVIAYKGRNTVAAIGRIDGAFDYNDRNSVGDQQGLISYSNQFPVKWEDSPRYFHRSKLVPELSYWVALPGTVYIKKNFEVNSIDEIFR